MRIGILHLFDANEFMGTKLSIAIIEQFIDKKHDFKLFIMNKNYLGAAELMEGPWLPTIEEALEHYLNQWEREQIIDEMDRSNIFEQ